MTETNPVWAPIRPKPKALWSSPMQMAKAYQQAEPRPRVRLPRSQRYSLTVTEPKEGTECPT